VDGCDGEGGRGGINTKPGKEPQEEANGGNGVEHGGVEGLGGYFQILHGEQMDANEERGD
tara:strand:+ start:1153 stop:1332 length:180 start_codon:yes stop_codon:yes gene_type:complete